jgi:hypothetical protein
VAVQDYYEQYPWTMAGVNYVCPLRGLNIAPDCERDSDEFNETHADILRFFGPERAGTPVYEDDGPRVATPELPMPPALTRERTLVAEDAGAGTGSRLGLAEDCPRHHIRSPYTQNSEGYYASAAPACNGCWMGLSDCIAQELAEVVYARDAELAQIWRTRYAPSEAFTTAQDLYDAIHRLETISRVIVTPVDYADRTLRMHNTAMALHRALVEIGVPHERKRVNANACLTALLALQDRHYADPAGYPIVREARAFLARI